MQITGNNPAQKERNIKMDFKLHKKPRNI